jgi:hypothetical protein
MSQINLNNTSPAAPSGNTNITWQIDVSNNVSAYVPNAKQQRGLRLVRDAGARHGVVRVCRYARVQCYGGDCPQMTLFER